MIELSVLGTLGLRRDGTELRSVLVRPKQVALLAYLAAAEPRGFHQRNELLALFWPESDEKRARFSLRNALYALRTDLGGDAIQVRGDAELALDHTIVRCDAVAFEQALDTADLETALGWYRGPLLNGVVIPGLSEFHSWLDGRRDTLRRRALQATITLSEEAERAGDWTRALEWARRMETLAPYDEVAIRRQVTLLERSSDRVAAAQALERWTVRLRAELDAEPSAETVALATRLRQPAMAGSYAPPPAEPISPMVIAASLPAAKVPTPSLPTAIPSRTKRRMPTTLAVVAAGVLLAAAGLFVFRRSPTNDAGAALTGTVVLPFAYDGEPRSAYLGSAMATLLSGSLGTSGPMAGLDPRAVAASVADAGARSRASDVQLGQRIGLQLRARYFVVGTIVKTQGAIRVEGALYDVSAPTRRLAGATAEGDADSLFAVADRLAQDLLAERTGGVRSSSLGTRSTEAVRAYVDGERALLTAHYADAADAFARSVRADSLFARGWYRLGYAAGWAGRSELALGATAKALTLADRLSRPDSQLLAGWSDFLNGRLERARYWYESFVTHDSRNVEAWLQLGELRFHWGAMLGSAPADAAIAFRHVLALAPDQSVALVHLARLVAREEPTSTAAFDSLRRAAEGAEVDPAEQLELRALAAVMHGDITAQRRVVADVADRPAVAGILIRLLLPVPASQAMVEALARGVIRAGGATNVEYGSLQLANLFALHGRYAAALAVLDTLSRTSSARALEGRAWLSLVPTYAAQRGDLQRLARALASASDAAIPTQRRLYLAGALALMAGDSASARLAALRLAQVGMSHDSAVAEKARANGRLLSAQLLATMDPSAAVASLGPTSVEPGNTFPDLYDFVNARERFFRAEALERAQRNEEALRWYGSFPDASSYDVWFEPAVLLRRAALRSASGDVAEARADYARFIVLWQDADPALQPVVAEARERLGRLGR